MTIVVDGSKIVANQAIIGEVTEDGIELNLAWLRLAGVGLKVYGDKNDQRRVVLDRQLHVTQEDAA